MAPGAARGARGSGALPGDRLRVRDDAPRRDVWVVERLGPEVDGLEVVGLEIDPARVAAVAADRDPPRVDFRVAAAMAVALDALQSR